MNTQHQAGSVEHFEAPVEEERTTPLGYFGTAAVAVAVAIACYTPLWDEVADPERTGRRSGLSRLLADIGPLPIAILCAGIAAVALYLAVKARAPKRTKIAE